MFGWLLLERVAVLRGCSSSAVSVVRVARASLCSSFSSSSEFDRSRSDDFRSSNKREEDRKKRKRYALGGCLVAIFFSSHAVLLWRRRNEFRTLNKILPPVGWEKFANDYLAQGRVKSIVFQPHFHVGDAYLQCGEEVERQKLKQHFLSTFGAGPEKFTRTPDIRFTFDGDSDALENSIEKALADGKESCDIHLEINRFPSYRELAFIFMTVLFTLAATGLMKF
uniref:Transmembrane protein n=1 Tax=Parascaris univalens TaxID=6257 RepID=A0A915BF86_PARUN